MRALRRVWPRPRLPQEKVTINPEEVRHAVFESDLTAQHWEGIFEDHDILKLNYEDLVSDPKPEFDRIQSFVGVTLAELEVKTARQNPEPLEELVANYSELRGAFKGTEYGAMLD